MGGDVGISLQVQIAEGNESSHCGREETGLERARKNTRLFSSSNFCTRVRYKETMAPERSVSFGAVISSPAFSDIACCGESVGAGGSRSAQAEITSSSVHHAC